MFINKKFLALALLPLFAACVVDDDGDDTNAETGTNPTSTMTATDPSATETDPTATGSTTEDPTDPTGDTTVGDTETDTGGDAGFCAPACAEAVDCCPPADPNCEAGIGMYPYTYTCDGGACSYAGCTDDAECEAVLPGQVCADFGGFGICQTGCVEDADCLAPGFTCTGGGGTYCEPPGCTMDADCGAAATCNTETGDCEALPCEADADCGSLGVCDVETGACGCTAEADCDGGICIIP